MSMSHVAARAEVRALLDVLDLPMPVKRPAEASGNQTETDPFLGRAATGT